LSGRISSFQFRVSIIEFPSLFVWPASLTMETSEDRSTPILIMVAVVLLVLIIGGLLWLRRGLSPSTAVRPAMGAEEKAYLSQFSVADPRMSAAENFLGNTVTYLSARVTNHGSRAVRQLDLQLEFHDILEQVVLRETAHAITRRALPLKPGETRPFQVAFEHMPVDWNQAPPVITAEYVSF
jgi:hypothetical protein